jgi:hypothetical protein
MKASIATAILRRMTVECNGKCFGVPAVVTRIPKQVAYKGFQTKNKK